MYYKMLLITVIGTTVQAQQVPINNSLLEERQKSVHFQGVAGKEEVRKHAQALFRAIRNGDLEPIQDLLHNGLRVASFINRKDTDGNTPLITAVYGGNPDIVTAILQAQPELNIQNKRGDTALMVAAKNARISKEKVPAEKKKKESEKQVEDPFMKILNLLIAARADLNKQDASGQTALMLAASVGDEIMVKLLVKAGADVTLVNEQNGKNARNYAEDAENAEEFRIRGRPEEEMKYLENYIAIIELLMAEEKSIAELARLNTPSPVSGLGFQKSPLASRREAAARAEQEKRLASTVTPPSDRSSSSSNAQTMTSPSPEIFSFTPVNLSPSPIEKSNRPSPSSSPSPIILEE